MTPFVMTGNVGHEVRCRNGARKVCHHSAGMFVLEGGGTRRQGDKLTNGEVLASTTGTKSSCVREAVSLTTYL